MPSEWPFYMSLVVAVWSWLNPDYMAVAEVVLGLLTLGVAAWIAFRQFRIMAQQTQMMREQTAIAVRQEETAKRQGEIAETQHRILQEQLAKQPILRIRVLEQTPRDDVWLDVMLVASNNGSKAADGFHWEVFVGENLVGSVGFLDERRNFHSGEFAPFSETERYRKVEGHFTGRLFPMSNQELVRIRIRRNSPNAQRFVIRWRISCETGMVPGDLPGNIWFKKGADWGYETSSKGPLD